MWDLYSMLLKERIIMLFTAINDQVANTIIAQLLYLDREDPDKDINMYIQSPGGQSSPPAWPFTIRCSLSFARFHHLRGHGGQHGHRAALRRRQGQTLCAASFHHPHAPGARRVTGTGLGYGHRRQRNRPARMTSSRKYLSNIPASRWKKSPMIPTAIFS